MRLTFFKKLLNSKYFFLQAFLKNILRNKIFFYIIKKNSLDLFVKKEDINFVTFFLKNNILTKINTILDITVIDFPGKKKRFKLVYNMLSIQYSTRIFLHTFLQENDFITSIKKIFPSSSWLEREVWDMFGIIFLNNFDLRRILTDYGFKGFPLKKDFPLTGYIELRHDDSKGDIVYEPLELTQELRFFNFSTGWEKDF